MQSVLRWLLFLVLFLLVSANCEATQVVVIIVHDGIVIAADSKSTDEAQNNREGSGQKIFVMNKRVAVMIDGLVGIRIKGSSEYLYNCGPLLRDVKEAEPKNADITIIERIIVDKLKPAMKAISSDMARMSRYQKSSMNRSDGLQFVVTGYENSIPIIHTIDYKFEWDVRKIVGPSITVSHPKFGRNTDSDVEFFGQSIALRAAAVSSSIEANTAARKYPGVIRALQMFKSQSSSTVQDAILMAEDMVRLEIEFEPEHVGPPINVVTLLRRGGTPVIQSLPK